MTEPSTAAQPLLEVTGLHVRFEVRRGLRDVLARRPRRFVHAVSDVDLRVQHGEVLALVGESGSGKSTTAQAVVGAGPVTEGSVQVEGRELGTLTRHELHDLRRRVQMVYQDPYESLDPRFTVGRTVAEPLLVHAMAPDRAAREALVVEALERAGLAPARAFLDRLPHELSGGQRQRVAIAAALVLGPRLLVADEPVSMLDVSVRAGVLELFDDLRAQGLGIVMITHDMSTAARHADRIAVMYLGRVVEEGPAAEVIGSPAHPYTQALVAAVPRLRHRAGTAGARGEAPDATDPPPGCAFHPRCPDAVARCREEQPVLLPVRTRAGRAACPESDATTTAVRS